MFPFAAPHSCGGARSEMRSTTRLFAQISSIDVDDRIYSTSSVQLPGLVPEIHWNRFSMRVADNDLDHRTLLPSQFAKSVQVSRTVH